MSLIENIDLLTGRIVEEFRTLKTQISGSPTGDTSALETESTNLVGAVNELKADIAAGLADVGASGLVIDDAAASATKTYSSEKIENVVGTSVQAAVAGLVDAAPESLDTLKEIADALAANDGVIGGLVEVLGSKASTEALETALELKADKTGVYTKAEADAALATAVSSAALGVDSVSVISSADASVYADSSVQPMEDPAGRSGWYFKNAVAGQKINWYIYMNSGLRAAHTRAALTSVWAVFTFYDNRARPFINLYSNRLADGQDAASWYRSRWVLDQYAVAPVANTKYLVFFGTDPGVHLELPRLRITDTTDMFDKGPRNSAEMLSMISWASNSGIAANAETWTMHSQGYSIAGEDFSAPLVHVGATQAQLAAGLALKANTASVYTKAESDAAVSTAVNNLINAAPGTLDTLGEIAAVMANDQNAAAALAQLVATKANSADVYTKAESDAALDLKVDKVALGDLMTDFVAAFNAALADGSSGGDLEFGPGRG